MSSCRASGQRRDFLHADRQATEAPDVLLAERDPEMDPAEGAQGRDYLIPKSNIRKEET